MMHDIMESTLSDTWKVSMFQQQDVEDVRDKG